jgi:hypothetical protein
VIANLVPNTGSFLWTVPNIRSETVQVRVRDAEDPSVFDISDADFTILGPDNASYLPAISFYVPDYEDD